MAELEWQGTIEPASLRRALRHALRRTAPGWRVVAEVFLAATTPIDLLAIGEAGELVCVRAVGSAAPAGAALDGGARLLAQGLSDLGWLAPRIADLHKLAPELGLRPLAPPRSQLVAPDFDAEVIAAAEHLGGILGDGRLSLLRYRPVRQQGQLALLLDPVKTGPAPLAETTSLALAATPTHGLTDPPSPSAFRTGLTDADLLLEPTALGS